MQVSSQNPYAESNAVIILRWSGRTTTVSVCRGDTASVIGANVIAAMQSGGRRIGAPAAPPRAEEDET